MKIKNWLVLFFCLMAANCALALSDAGTGWDGLDVMSRTPRWIERIKDLFHHHHECHYHWRC